MRVFLNFIIGLALSVATTTCPASVIKILPENSSSAPSWRTDTVAKTPNPALNNIYGNDGYFMFLTNTALPLSTDTYTASTTGAPTVNGFPFNSSVTSGGRTFRTMSQMPVYISSLQAGPTLTNGFMAGTYTTLDAAPPFSVSGTTVPSKNPGVQMRPGVVYIRNADVSHTLGVFTPIFTFTVNDRVPNDTFVVGLFFNNGQGFMRQLQVSSSLGGIATGSRTVFSNDYDAQFFFISGATPGETFTVAGVAFTSGTTVPGTNLVANGNLDISGITFDTIPEPTTLCGCAAAALGFIWLDRMRKKRSTPGFCA